MVNYTLILGTEAAVNGKLQLNLGTKITVHGQLHS